MHRSLACWEVRDGVFIAQQISLDTILEERRIGLAGPTYRFINVPNRPFPSSCLPPLPSESKCDVFVMVISSTLHINEN